MKNEFTRIIVGAIMTFAGFAGRVLTFKYVLPLGIDAIAMLWIFTGILFMIGFGMELIGSSMEEEDEEDCDYIIYVKER